MQGKRQSNGRGQDRSNRGQNSEGFNRQSRSNDNARNDETDSTPNKIQLLRTLKNALPQSNGHSYIMGAEKLTPSKNQKEIVNLINNKDVVFVNGPIGSGKTLWTCLTALQGLSDGKFEKISLTAPAVEADEELGFMPGGKDEKMHQHVNQILETIDDLIGESRRKAMIECGLIEIAPHAFNRGRTYKKTLYILDESQNASARQLLTSLGRLGFRSTFVYMGDDKQNDRTAGKSAFVAFKNRFTQAAYAEEIGSVTLTAEDVRRHPLLKKIVERGDDGPLDGFEDRQDSKIGRKPQQGGSFPDLRQP